MKGIALNPGTRGTIPNGARYIHSSALQALSPLPIYARLKREVGAQAPISFSRGN